MKPMFNGYHPNLVSPKLWPESAVFVTGYPKKEVFFQNIFFIYDFYL
jgi:hypothetical protein